jgi:parallel beta-helix repeat protein
VAIPAGVYMISAELNIRDGQTIAPQAGAQVIFKAAAGYTGRFISTVDKSFTLRGITFDGNYAGRAAQEGASAANLLTIVGGTNVTLTENTFRYAPAYAVWAYRSASLQIQGNSFVECWQPIRIDANRLPGGTIENNTFTNTAAYKSIQHLDAINTVNLVVRGNTMSGAGVGVPTNHGYEGTWGNSIYIFNSDGYLVENNTVSRNYWSSIVVGQNSTNATVRGNRFSHGVHGGNTGGLQSSWIEQVGNRSITFTNNILVGGLSAGDTGGDYLTITYNDITVPPGGTGINADFMFKHGLIANNTIREANGSRTSTGIFLWNKNTPDVSIQVNNNAVSGFSRAIAINNDGGVGTVYGIRLSGNTFSNNTTNVWVPSAIQLPQPLGQ